jgi:hypothetical protein
MPDLSTRPHPEPLAKRACRRVIQKAAPVVRLGTFFETRLRRSSERGPREGLRVAKLLCDRFWRPTPWKGSAGAKTAVARSSVAAGPEGAKGLGVTKLRKEQLSY